MTSREGSIVIEMNGGGVSVIPDLVFHLDGRGREREEGRGEVTEEGEGVETREYTIEIHKRLY